VISRTKKRFYISLVLTIIMFLSAGCRSKPSQKKPDEEMLYGKPVIYLYPVKEQEVSVKLDFQGQLICTYPEYKDGWTVTAKPDGTLINHEDNREYSYLFWEGTGKDDWDMSKGFVVKGEDTKDFLQQTLSQMGLSPREYNELIVYWLPQMQNNKYNLISFMEQEYEEYAKLTIIPTPDSILRVFMVFKALGEPIDIEEQKIRPFKRRGFTVIEWGGAEVK
jgi:hypothetical protein